MEPLQRKLSFPLLFSAIVSVFALILSLFLVIYITKKQLSTPAPIHTKPVRQHREQIGVLETTGGIFILTSTGSISKDAKHNLLIIPAPWTNIIQKNIAVSRTLTRDGSIFFVGNSEIADAPSSNTIYKWHYQQPHKIATVLSVEDIYTVTSFAIDPTESLIAISGMNDSLESDTANVTKTPEELRRIYIYDLKTHTKLSSIQLPEAENSDNRVNPVWLRWKEKGLFVFDRVQDQVVVYNFPSQSVIARIPNIHTSTEELLTSIVLDSKGEYYYNPASLTVHLVKDNSEVARLYSPEIDEGEFIWVGPATFAQNSDKILIQLRNIDQTNFQLYDLDFVKDTTQKIVDKETFRGVNLADPQTNSFLFLTYDSEGDDIYFAATSSFYDMMETIDIYQLKKGNTYANLLYEFRRGREFDNMLTMFMSFYGWYLPN